MAFTWRTMSWTQSYRSWQTFQRHLNTARWTSALGIQNHKFIPFPGQCIQSCKPHIKANLDETQELSQMLQKLSTRDQPLPLINANIISQIKYIFPTVSTNSLWKTTVVDPMATPIPYDLLTGFSKINEKITPSVEHLFPLMDPDSLQSVIDQGVPPVSKQAMPWLVQIRKRKMKKHKLKKLRKRMKFVYRKQREIRKKRKEKAIQMEIKQILKEAEEFDAQIYVEGELKKARAGGWGIDIMAEYHKTKKNESSNPHSGTVGSRNSQTAGSDMQSASK